MLTRFLLFVGFVTFRWINGNNEYDTIYPRQASNAWFQSGTHKIKENLKYKEINKKAKGVILFIGDGMGPSTVTAARILQGQLKGKEGEEEILSWEDFPNVAFSKTYNTNQQVADSAGTGTAFMTGVKTDAGVISVDEKVKRGKCSSQHDTEILSILQMAEHRGLSTGIVTTTRLTHATPAVSYAHAADRAWESDRNLPVNARGKCDDIARQFIEFKYGDGVDVAFGGGRKNFLPEEELDVNSKDKRGRRLDKRNLINEWLNKSTEHKYVHDLDGLNVLDPHKRQKVLGLFNYDHMEYEYNRKKGKKNEPSLTRMVEYAIKALSHNSKGFFLLVEAGRIDHGHHKNKPVLALHDAVELARAVQKAKQLTVQNETLLIVTADHSHVFTMGGYQKKGNNIFGRAAYKSSDGKHYSTLSYANGPSGQIGTKARKEPTVENLRHSGYKYEALVPLWSETHGGEDVGIYARGPQSHLIRGTVEQNYIFHAMDYALCLSESKRDICKEEGLI